MKPDNRTAARFILIATFFIIITTASLLAWTTRPTAIFVGRVLSTAKVTDVIVGTNSNGSFRVTEQELSDANKDTITHWELWKAEVKVMKVQQEWPGLAANLPEKVFVYYTQDWSTNFMTVFGVDASHPPRLRLGTNLVYRFTCANSDAGKETGSFRAMDVGIDPQ